MEIETARLTIRSPIVGDFETSFQIWGHSEVRKFSGGAASRKVFEKGFLEDLEKAETRFGFRTVLLKENGKHIGDVGLIEKTLENKPIIELVYFFNFDYWGKGYASEAATALVDFAREQKDIERLTALIHPENKASEKVAQKILMKYERNAMTNSGNERKLYSLTL